MSTIWELLVALATAFGLIQKEEREAVVQFDTDADAAAKAAADAKTKEQADAALKALADLHNRS